MVKVQRRSVSEIFSYKWDIFITVSPPKDQRALQKGQRMVRAEDPGGSEWNSGF